MFKSKKAAEQGAAAPAAASKKRGVIANRTDEDFSVFNKVVVEKPAAERKKIGDVLSAHYVFADLQAKTIQDVVDVMKPCPVTAGTDIITQGDSGDLFYVMCGGIAKVLVGGNHVHTYDGASAFGELSLMYSAPRAATIRADTDCNCYSLDLRSFRFILSKTASSGLMAKCEFVKKVKLLSALNDQMVNQVASALVEETFREGEYIITQGEEGDKFYIIADGNVKCTSTKEGGAEIDLITCKAGDYFGEMALMLNEPRHANCIAFGGPVTCFVLSRENFMLILGGMDKITQTLAQQMRIRILKSVPLLAMLTDDELIQVANSMRVQCFGPGEVIIEEGQKGERFYIINDGEVAVSKNNGGTEVEITRLSNQEYFGERALIREEPRKATIKAVGEVECLVLERAAFLKLLLPTQDKTFEEEMLSREQMSSGSGGGAGGRRAAAQIPFEELDMLATIGTGTFGRSETTRHSRLERASRNSREGVPPPPRNVPFKPLGANLSGYGATNRGLGLPQFQIRSHLLAILRTPSRSPENRKRWDRKDGSRSLAYWHGAQGRGGRLFRPVLKWDPAVLLVASLFIPRIVLEWGGGGTHELPFFFFS
mmetsp:Transcript_19753/g.44798  ORF Transcript_19753/g.44798 Transcript_19753/m.44798 type:complete len:598 (-) Transcript_19753:55-1848(-)